MATLKLSKSAVRASVPAVKERVHYVVVRGRAVRYVPTGEIVHTDVPAHAWSSYDRGVRR